MSVSQSPRRVAVVGGGVAGLAAACALAQGGYAVEVFERRPYVGGRASSYLHPGVGEVIDNCQHIVLGCCTNVLDLLRRANAQDTILWSDGITFLEPGGRQSKLTPALLPAPLHSTPSFLAAKALRLRDKIAIARAIAVFLKGSRPEDDRRNFSDWLQSTGQTPRAVEHFWKPVLFSALNEDPDRISVRYAAKVFREAFLFSAEAGRMGVPRVPLSEMYGQVATAIERAGGKVRLRSTVERLCRDEASGRWRLQVGEQVEEFDAVVLALSFDGMERLLPALPEGAARDRLQRLLAGFSHSPLTGIHLWFDREITPLHHAVLLETTVQWLYNTSRIQPERQSMRDGHLIELVVSASKSLVPMERQAVIDLALRELALFFPAMQEAILLKAAVVKEVRATYSIVPGLDELRPAAESGWPGLMLAGDWTATGWPSTMEGAARSGYLAAEAVSREAGNAQRYLVPDLPRRGLMRLLP
ncbi:MAG TPA: hydroxysqualene dehydroxylase HpnE [Acidobacteriaceae bacterium]|nr:hydroxysqualene dehydroxylase HpnE [Acidobacteriaceae bacterium]